MRQIHIPRLERNVSAIGFGCASFGSRVSSATGREAVFRALDRGVTWFDVAPSYGDGRAEDLLGWSLEGVRKDVVVCTKVRYRSASNFCCPSSIQADSQKSSKSVAALEAPCKPSAPCRATLKRCSKQIEGLVKESLRRLRTDYIDVLALHEPSPLEAANEAVHKAVDQLIQKGLVRAVSIAGQREAIFAAAAVGCAFDFAQFPDSPFDDVARALRMGLASGRPVFVTHGVFGSGLLEKFARLGDAKRAALILLSQENETGALTDAEMLLNFAFSNNPDGVVVLSMFSRLHIDRNCTIASQVPEATLADAMRRIVCSPGAGNG